MEGNDAPIWSRHFCSEPDASDCELLTKTLTALGIKRMVLGHTIHKSVTSHCDAQVWCIDVGMARHYGGSTQALEIEGDRVTPLRQDDSSTRR